ncbi:uncharacterized protein LOC133902089 [Phragmites australis]|uniref:uncharacterized protein LOC133902089 n=1 Tax=Phragmites australis TaxID=29695 RepID=UPI002D7A06BC|nr:uncharacterized protein LOC133902089 [Phragmites australis]
MVRPRPKRGERRIDAAIDHLAEYGFPKTLIRRTINNFLQLYGRDGWVFLEEGSYRVVLEKLLEEQAQQQQKDQQQEVAADEAPPENDMQISRVHSEAPTKSQSALEQHASPNSSRPLEPVLPLPPVTKAAAAARPPCRGWISEESESESEDGEVFPDIPSPAESLPSKRKRPSRWDVRPN